VNDCPGIFLKSRYLPTRKWSVCIKYREVELGRGTVMSLRYKPSVGSDFENLKSFAGQHVVVSTIEWEYQGKLEVVSTEGLVLTVGDLIYTIDLKKVKAITLK
jgi:hypothetical protein